MKREAYIAILSCIVLLALYFWLRKHWLSDVKLEYGPVVEDGPVYDEFSI